MPLSDSLPIIYTNTQLITINKFETKGWMYVFFTKIKYGNSIKAKITEKSILNNVILSIVFIIILVILINKFYTVFSGWFELSYDSLPRCHGFSSSYFGRRCSILFGLLAGCKQYSAKNRATMSATLCVLGGYSFMCFPRMTNIFLSIRLRKPYYNISAMCNSSLPSRPTQATFLHALTRQDSCNHADYGELCPCSNLCNFS